MKKLIFGVVLAVMLMLTIAASAFALNEDNDGNYYCSGYCQPFQGDQGDQPGYLQSSNSFSGYSCH